MPISGKANYTVIGNTDPTDKHIGDRDAAETTFNELKAANSGVPYQLYIERIASYREDHPGENWDRVFTLTSK